MAERALPFPRTQSKCLSTRRNKLVEHDCNVAFAILSVFFNFALAGASSMEAIALGKTPYF